MGRPVEKVRTIWYALALLGGADVSAWYARETDNCRRGGSLMARIPFSSGSDSGSDSTNTTAGDDDSQENRREAVEEEPRIRLPGSDSTDDTSSTGSSASTDTGRSNRQQAVDEDPGIDVTPPSQVDTDTTPDDNTSNRQAAVNADQQLSQGIDNADTQQTTGSDPTGARREAVEQEPDVPVRPSGPEVDPGDARQEAVAADQQRTNQQTQPDPQPTDDRPSTGGEELERIRREAAASQDNLGPSDIRITENGDGEFDIQLSDEGIRQQATGDIPTLDADDVRIGEDGSVELTRQARQQRVRSQAALNLGVSQEEVRLVRDGSGDISTLLTEEAERTAITNQLTDLDDIAREDIETVERNGSIEGQLTDEALRTRAASQREELDPQDIEVTVEDGERQAQLTDDAARDLLKQEVASQTNVEESDVRISRGEDGELLARYQPEQPDVAEDPISRVARSGVERIFGSKPPTQDDLLDGLNQGVGDILGVDIPTQGEVSDEFRELSQDELGFTPPTQQELLDDLQGGVEGATGVTLPTNEELTQPLQDRASDIAGTDLEQFSDAETAAAAGLPFAAAEPTPLGEAALVGVVGTAAAAQAASQAGGPVNEEIRPEDLEGGAFSGGEIPIEQPTRREIPVVDGQSNSELDVPLEEIRNQSEIDVPDSLDRSEIQITDGGEVTVPADFSGNVVIQRGETEQEDIERQENSEDVIVQVPDEFIPDEQVTIGEQDGFVDEDGPTVDEGDTIQEDAFDDDGAFQEREDAVQDEFVEPAQPTVEAPGLDIEDDFPADTGASAQPTTRPQLPGLNTEADSVLEEAQGVDIGQTPFLSTQPTQNFRSDLFSEPASSLFTNGDVITTGEINSEPFDATVDTGLQDPFEFEAFSGAPSRGRRTGQRFDSIIPQRDEEDFGLDLPFDETSDLEDTGILSADDVRRLF
jgi:hypothetical protein